MTTGSRHDSNHSKDEREERRAASDAGVNAGLVELVILAGLGHFRAGLPEDTVLLGSEQLPPFVLRLRTTLAAFA